MTETPRDLHALMGEMGRAARRAARRLAESSATDRTGALLAMAQSLGDAQAEILSANAADLAGAEGALSSAMLDRLRLSPAAVADMARALEAIAAQPDPVGVEMARWTPPNGLDIARVRTPIGVLAVIYESRPNVTAEAAGLCLRSANAVILRCGSEAHHSARAVHAALARGLVAADLPAEAVQLVPTTDRAAVGLILQGLEGAIDLVIPRGGRSLVERVQAEARVAVLGHLEGINHTYVHLGAALETARRIVLNAKMRRVAVCGATETLLIDRAVAPAQLPAIAADLIAAGCTLRGDAAACALVGSMAEAVEADWSAEYLAPTLAVRVVEGLDAALDHIRRYGSGHTEAIITEDTAAAERFLAEVDSAIVLWNASTQFADGGEFGFGGEIGISTSKLHARGPVGAEQLTTFKYIVRGTGQVRA